MAVGDGGVGDAGGVLGDGRDEAGLRRYQATSGGDRWDSASSCLASACGPEVNSPAVCTADPVGEFPPGVVWPEAGQDEGCREGESVVSRERD